MISQTNTSSFCPLCKKQVETEIFKIHKSIKWMYCENCGAGFGRPVLSQELHSLSYDKEYFQTNYLKNENKYLKQGKLFFKLISKYTSFGTLLDVGCGCGTISSIFNKNGWDTTIVEPSDAGREFAASYYNLYKQFSNLDDISSCKKYSLILIADVLTSIEKPDSFLSKLNQLLSPDGFLMIKTTLRSKRYLNGVRFISGLNTGVAGTLLDWPLCFNTFSHKSYQYITEYLNINLIEKHEINYPTPIFAPFLNKKWKMGVVNLYKRTLLSLCPHSTHVITLYKKRL